MMNRAEYEALASAIKEADIPAEYKEDMACEIADALCATNDRFDPWRFIQQCDLGITLEELSRYSHRLLLRTRTGVGHVRNQIRGIG